jgi:hypothetical protein
MVIGYGYRNVLYKACDLLFTADHMRNEIVISEEVLTTTQVPESKVYSFDMVIVENVQQVTYVYRNIPTQLGDYMAGNNGWWSYGINGSNPSFVGAFTDPFLSSKLDQAGINLNKLDFVSLSCRTINYVY